MFYIGSFRTVSFLFLSKIEMGLYIEVVNIDSCM